MEVTSNQIQQATSIQRSKKHVKEHHKNLQVKDQSVINNIELKWQATYIDGKFYLSDPTAFQKLKDLHKQIQQQKLKLENLYRSNPQQTINHSFISQRGQQIRQHSQKSRGCITEINYSLLDKKKNKAENDLVQQQEKYRKQINKNNKNKLDSKKQMLAVVKQDQDQGGAINPSQSSQLNQNNSKTKTNKQLILEKQLIEGSKKQQSIQIEQKKSKKESQRIDKSNKNQNNQFNDKSEKRKRSNKKFTLDYAEKSDKLQVIKGQQQNQIVEKSNKKLIIQSQEKSQRFQKSHKKSTIQDKIQKSIKKSVAGEQVEKSINKSKYQEQNEKNQIIEKSIKRSVAQEKLQKTEKIQKSIIKSVVETKQEKGDFIEKSNKGQIKKSEKPEKSQKKSHRIQENQQIQHSQKKQQHQHKGEQKSISYNHLSPPQQKSIKHSERKSQRKSKKVSNASRKRSSKKQKSLIKQQILEKISLSQQYQNQQIIKQTQISNLDIQNQQKDRNKSTKKSSIYKDDKSNRQKISNKNQNQCVQSVKQPQNYQEIVIQNNNKSIKSKSKKSNVNRSNIQHQLSVKIEQQKSQKSNKIQINNINQQYSYQSSDFFDSRIGKSMSQSNKQVQQQQSVKSKSKKVQKQDNQKRQRSKNRKKQQQISNRSSYYQQPYLHQHNTDESISSIKPNQIQIKPLNIYENKSVQWSQKPEVQQKIIQKSQEKIIQESQKNIKFKKNNKKVYEVEINNNQQQQKKQDHKILIQQQQQLKNQKKQKSIISKAISKSKKNVSQSKVQEINNSKLDIDIQQKKSQKKNNKSFLIHYPKGQTIIPKQKSLKGQQIQKNKILIKKSTNSVYDDKKSGHKSLRKQQHFKNKQAAEQSIISKQQIILLNNKIKELQQNLKKIQQRQDQIQKIQINTSKLQYLSDGNNSQPMSPLPQLKMITKFPQQSQLNISSSILQFNLAEEKKKQKIQQLQKTQKQRLKQQVNYLKKVIRQLQMEKIRSIDYQNSHNTLSASKVDQVQQRRQVKIQFRTGNNSKVFDKSKDQLNTHQVGSTLQLKWNSTISKFGRNSEQTGKIIKNSPYKSNIHDPSPHQKPYKMRMIGNLTRKQSQKSQPSFQNIQQFDQIPFKKNISTSPRKNINKQQTRQQILQRLDANEKGFQKFMEYSKIINQPQSHIEGYSVIANTQKIKQQEQAHQYKHSMIPLNLKKYTVIKNKNQIDQKSNLIDNIKKNNSIQQQPIDDIPPQQLQIEDWQMPKLPQNPNQQMEQHQLLNLAKKTYKIFGIQIQNQQNQLCMKKYKNCIMFTFGLQQQCILWHYSGKFYIGGWKSNDPGQGQKIGHGIQYIPGKHIYKGQFLNGKKNGNGILKTQLGNIYDGQWINGVKNGRGKYFQMSTGATYNGEWKDGKKDGFGILRFSQKQYYKGTFVKSIKQGYGIQKFLNGDMYKGQYYNGRFNGKGKYTWVNGSSYQGHFVDGCRQGQGIWKSALENGDIYIGQYANDKKSGYGRYTWGNGCIYEGYFLNDLKHGKGRLQYQDGKEIKGIWEQGSLIETQVQRKFNNHQDQPLRKSIKMSTMRVDQNKAYPQTNKYSAY